MEVIKELFNMADKGSLDPTKVDWAHLWLEKPSKYRDVLGKYSVEMRNLSLRILEMIREGLGLKRGIAIIELIKNMAFAAWFQVPSAMASSTSTLQWNDNTLMQLKPTSNTFAIVLAYLRDLIAAVSISSGNNCPEMSIMTVTDLQLIEYSV
ncbi:hyoscyamine 6-dioxygenase-like protein [Tanacetum coccineum]